MNMVFGRSTCGTHARHIVLNVIVVNESYRNVRIVEDWRC